MQLSELLNYQDEKGLFPTTGKKQNSVRILDSVYLHTFVLEYLLDHHRFSADVQIQKGLDFIFSQAIEEPEKELQENKRLIWQWLKTPPTPEDYRPPDTDDFCRVRLVIEKALRTGFKIPEEFNQNHNQTFYYESFLLPLLTSEGSVKTYIKERYAEICPEVNATILYTLLHITGLDYLKSNIAKYLKTVLDSDYLKQENFIDKSKYFMSPYFLLYVLSKSLVVEPELSSDISPGRIVEHVKNLTPTNILEKVWQNIILRNCGVKLDLISDSISDLTKQASHEYVPIFQSKNIKEKYGSPSATLVFCLESMRI